MDNKTEYFTLKEDGIIVWIEKYGCNLHGNPTCEMCPDWNLQSAISNAIEVSNQNDVKCAFWNKWDEGERMELGKPYPLQCHVEKKVIETKEIVLDLEFTGGKTVALVTFSEPEIRTALCIQGHPDGLTKGKIYNVVGESDKFFDIKPDDFGHLSGFDKRYFSEPSAGVEETQEGRISNKVLNYAFEICWLVKDHTANVIASLGKDETPSSDLEHNKKATAFINAYLRYNKTRKNK